VSKVTPKKHLGQHFLTDQQIAKRICESFFPEQSEILIEIGPGTGILTQFLIKYDHFQAFDVDHESVEYLKTEYPDHQDKISFRDFLKWKPSDLHSSVGIIGNLPYNISSQIFFSVYDHRNQVNQVVCMIQKEVADRIVSDHGNKVYGILSVLLQAFFDIKYLFTVKPGSFFPPPKVNSAVIRLERNQVKTLPCDETLFKRVVKSGFGKRRKTLRNALKDLPLPPSISGQEVFSKRAEQLPVSEFIRITQLITEAWQKS
jgi:16S rRNA (adenine1518-N6/adenine1519-N6)-dimethyltransferase